MEIVCENISCPLIFQKLFNLMKSINLCISHKCTLECSKCLRKTYRTNNLKVPGYDLSLHEYKKIINYFDFINFCGNASDPVMNPNLINFLKLNYEKNIFCEVHNAATGKKISWYEKAFNANKNATWIFGLDGYPEDSHKYRINQDGEALFEAMKLCASMGLESTWRYIVFKYNENDMEDCKNIAKHYNIKFELVKSSRFIKNDSYKPTKYYIERNYGSSKMSKC